MQAKKILIHSTLTLLAVIILVLFVYIDKIIDRFTQIKYPNKTTIDTPSTPYEYVPGSQKILTDVKRAGKYLPLTETSLWESELKDQVIDTPNNGPLHIKRATIKGEFVAGQMMVEFENGKNYRLEIGNNIYVSAPIYAYENDSDIITSYRRKRLDRSALVYLKINSVVIVKYYESNDNESEKTIIPHEIIFADVKNVF